MESKTKLISGISSYVLRTFSWSGSGNEIFRSLAQSAAEVVRHSVFFEQLCLIFLEVFWDCLLHYLEVFLVCLGVMISLQLSLLYSEIQMIWWISIGFLSCAWLASVSYWYYFILVLVDATFAKAGSELPVRAWHFSMHRFLLSFKIALPVLLLL